jgi:hypothetical protein
MCHISALLISLFSVGAWAEGESSRTCTIVSTTTKYLGDSPICVQDLRCEICFSGVRLACHDERMPAWCRPENCGSAQACLDHSILLSEARMLKNAPSGDGSEFPNPYGGSGDSGFPKPHRGGVSH